MFLAPWGQLLIRNLSAKETDPRERHAGDEVSFAPLDQVVWLERVNRRVWWEVWSLVPGMYMVELMQTDRGSSGYVLGLCGGIVRSPEASIAVLVTLNASVCWNHASIREGMGEVIEKTKSRARGGSLRLSSLDFRTSHRVYI